MSRRRWGRVRKLHSGRWQARYPHPDTGTLTTAPETFRTKTDAARWLDRAEVDQTRGEWTDPTSMALPLGPWGERWIASQTHWKPKTRADNESLWKTHIEPRFGTVKLGAVRPIDVQEWVSGLTSRSPDEDGGSRRGSEAGRASGSQHDLRHEATTLSASRVRKAYGLLAQIMAAAEHNQLIPVTPCRGVRLPRLAQTDPEILTPEQVKRLADTITAPHDVAVYLMAYAGLRVGELFALRRRHFDALHGRVLVQDNLSEVAGHLHTVDPKNHQQREVSLHPAIALLVAEHCGTLPPDPEALLFEAPRGGPVRYTNWLHRVWEPAVLTANLPGVTPHDLRATHASWVVDSGGSILEAAARLGHGSAAVTSKHYARTVSGRDAEVAGKLRVVES